MIDKKNYNEIWDELSEYPGFGVTPNYNGPKYRVRDLVERQKQLGRYLTEEERKEFEVVETPSVKGAYAISDGILVVFSDDTVRKYEKSVLQDKAVLDISNVIYSKGTPLPKIKFA